MAQSIIHTLSQIRGGAALADADRLCADVVKAVKETGKKGSVTLTIIIEPDKTDNTVVTLQPDVTVKTPRRAYAKGIFFVDDRTGELSREDPRQIEMDLKRKAELAEQNAVAITKVGRGTD